jgi:hypothetical protein
VGEDRIEVDEIERALGEAEPEAFPDRSPAGVIALVFDLQEFEAEAWMAPLDVAFAPTNRRSIDVEPPVDGELACAMENS